MPAPGSGGDTFVAAGRFLISSGPWPSGVCWRYPLPQGNDLSAVWGASSSDVWAVGRGGTILHWDGVVWTGTTALAPDELHSVHGSGASDVWAVGNYSKVDSAFKTLSLHCC